MEHTRTRTWRLIYSPALDGAMNMALDEAILTSVSEGTSPSTLRLYAWDPPCLSIGHAQTCNDLDRERLEQLGWNWVRRPTGGRALLHIDELTYSVCAPVGDPLLSGDVLSAYRRLSVGIVRGLVGIGLSPEVQPAQPSGRGRTPNPVCFEVPSAYEITVGGKKLVGSAQVRRVRGALQHGSIPLAGDIARVCEGLRFESEGAREQAARRLRSRATTIEAVTGRTIDWADAASALARGFAEGLGLVWIEDTPSAAELARARELARTRFTSEEWNSRL